MNAAGGITKGKTIGTLLHLFGKQPVHGLLHREIGLCAVKRRQYLLPLDFGNDLDSRNQLIRAMMEDDFKEKTRLMNIVQMINDMNKEDDTEYGKVLNIEIND